MINPTFVFAALCSGALLLASCDSSQTTETAATGTAAAVLDSSAAGTTAGMDHSQMAAPTAPASPLMASMNDMMTRMDATQPKGNVDHDFAQHMLAHHRGAVAMADIELRDGKDAAMRQLARKIKADQQQEITALEAAATRLGNAPSNYKPMDPADPFTSKMRSSMDGMMKSLPKEVANPDMNFNMLMVVHHQSAVEMAQAELDHGKDAKLKEMAQKMVNAQQEEIMAFKA